MLLLDGLYCALPYGGWRFSRVRYAELLMIDVHTKNRHPCFRPSMFLVRGFDPALEDIVYKPFPDPAQERRLPVRSAALSAGRQQRRCAARAAAVVPPIADAAPSVLDEEGADDALVDIARDLLEADVWHHSDPQSEDNDDDNGDLRHPSCAGAGPRHVVIEPVHQNVGEAPPEAAPAVPPAAPPAAARASRVAYTASVFGPFQLTWSRAGSVGASCLCHKNFLDNNSCKTTITFNAGGGQDQDRRKMKAWLLAGVHIDADAPDGRSQHIQERAHVVHTKCSEADELAMDVEAAGLHVQRPSRS